MAFRRLRRRLSKTALWRRLRYHAGGTVSPVRGHHDAVDIACGRDLVLSAFWKDQANGKGPGALARVRTQRIVLFDCFGAGDAHWHLAFTPHPYDRIRFLEPTAEAQIERTVFELGHNLPAYIRAHPWPEVRATRVDPVALREAAHEVGRTLLRFLDTVPELEELRGDTARTP